MASSSVVSPFASGQQGSPKQSGSWVQEGRLGTGWVAGPGASSLEAALGQPQRWRRRPLSASGFGLRLFLRSYWKGLLTDAGVSGVRAGLVEVRARSGDVGCARTLPFTSLLLRSFKGPEPEAISIPGNPQAICEQREPEPSREAGPVRPSLRSGGSRPGSAAGVPASGVRQEQRGAGVCGGWKQPEGVRGNKAGVGGEADGGGGYGTCSECGVGFPAWSGGALAAGLTATAARRPLSRTRPWILDPSSPPPAPSEPRAPARPTD